MKDMSYSIRQIADIVSAKATIQENGIIRYLLTDSRTLSDPESTLFFALRTSHNDGHKYIIKLYEQGVRNFVIQSHFQEYDTIPDANLLLVENTLIALQELGAYHRHQFSFPIIGITGSNGKTIVKEWLYQLLSVAFNITRSPRSYNSQIGVPLSVWQLNKTSELGIFEAGISQPYEMERLENIIKPTIGILTNIGIAHQENFSSLKEKCLEKLNLFKDVGLLIYNSDDSLIADTVLSYAGNYKTFPWSKKNPLAPLYIQQIEKNKSGTVIQYQFQENESRIRIPFTDEASVENSIHCLALLLNLPDIFPEKTFDYKNFEEHFSSLEPVAMRLEVKKGINNCILINDTYNSDINSLDIALDFMFQRSLDNKLKPVLILSDILQSGIPTSVFYEKVAELISRKQVQQIIGIGSDLSKYAAKFQMEKEFYLSTETFLSSGKINSIRNSILLIKGSRSFEFEKITERLEEKVHETMLEVDLDAVIHNFKYFRSKLNPKTKIICMVKAFGYGVGSYELAKTLQNQGCDYLAVAVADEGAELRREGITMPILVMNPETHSFNTLFDYKLEPEIYNFRMLKNILKEADKRGISQYPIHIKVDTGMHRLGFNPDEIEELTTLFSRQSTFKISSIFTHLAGSDASEHDDYTRMQLNLFQSVSAELEQSLPYPILKHALNSAGIERFPEYQSDIVRLGIGLYGISVIDKEALKPVATLKTTILQIKNCKKKDTVGYNRNGILTRDSRIACLPIGYADGLNRKLSNRQGAVLIDGKRCPIIGNICMDLCMVDVTDTNAKEGDSAIIFGQEITIEEIANQLETIPYEILTSISPRVKRIYFKN